MREQRSASAAVAACCGSTGGAWPGRGRGCRSSCQQVCRLSCLALPLPMSRAAREGPPAVVATLMIAGMPRPLPGPGGLSAGPRTTWEQAARPAVRKAGSGPRAGARRWVLHSLAPWERPGFPAACVVAAQAGAAVRFARRLCAAMFCSNAPVFFFFAFTWRTVRCRGSAAIRRFPHAYAPPSWCLSLCNSLQRMTHRQRRCSSGP